MANISNYKRIGIPLVEVGKRLEQLNEAVKGSNMALQADCKIELDCSRDETALSAQVTVYFLDDGKEEGKENG